MAQPCGRAMWATIGRHSVVRLQPDWVFRQREYRGGPTMQVVSSVRETNTPTRHIYSGWNYGDDAQKAIAASLEERYRLMPYIYSIASAVTNDGYTLMRPLVFDFSDDPEALKQKYEYMFGPSLLVSPVTQPDVSTWDTYLPKNDAGWYDFRTGKYYEGGQTVTTDARRIPVFVRGGSILPLCKDRQYALDQPEAPLEIQVYPGKDASFTLYQDDGVSNNYQNGQWSSAELQWDEKQRQLHVNEKSGNSNPPQKLKYSIKIIPR